MVLLDNYKKDPYFFVVGLQKSGTYWITALLNAHPDIRCLPDAYGGQNGVEEGRIFDVLASIKNDNGNAFKKSFLNHHNGFYADLVPYVDKVSRIELFNMFRARYSEYLYRHKGKKQIVGDKTTEYIFHLDMIDDFYPNVKKICIIRNPKDRIVSWHFQQIRKNRKTNSKISNKFIKEYCETRIKKEYESMLAYNGKIYCLLYEDMYTDPYQNTKDILCYLKMRSTNKIVEFMVNEASLESCRKKDKIYQKAKNKKRGEQVIKSHYRKGIINDWKNYLDKEQIKLVGTILSDLEKKVFKKYNIKQ